MWGSGAYPNFYCHLQDIFQGRSPFVVPDLTGRCTGEMGSISRGRRASISINFQGKMTNAGSKPANRLVNQHAKLGSCTLLSGCHPTKGLPFFCDLAIARIASFVEILKVNPPILKSSLLLMIWLVLEPTPLKNDGVRQLGL